MLLCLIASLIWIRSNWISGIVTVIFAISYFLFTTIAMGKNYLWIDCAYPLFLILITFTVVYILKFIKKSKDFERTYKLATTDGLTGLFNHRYFQEQMQANIYNANRYENNFSLVLIDIDFFKKFNDTFGHQAGDEVLRTVAKILKKYVRASDVVCRYGGEEMTIILTNTNHTAAISAAQKICDSVSSTTFKLIDNIDCHVTISLGVSTYPEHGKTPTELIEYADKYLYKAKENGRNQVGNTISDTEENKNN
jgi:diguanylate cyclase (GGDEF)-like protein